MTDIETLQREHQVMREMLDQVLAESVCLKEDLKTAIKAYRELILKYDELESRSQR